MLLEGTQVSDETDAQQTVGENQYGGHLDSGGEHAVYISDDGQHVTKITLPGLHGYVPTEDVASDIQGDFYRIKLRQATPAEYFLRTALFSRLTGIDSEAAQTDERDGPVACP
ncbi:MAG TPA: hypothetical protein DDZ88_04410 [Verrucomicrobiales bacterium]|nr:hypothetical protein [Verrucomicrobiales bacterium]